MRSVVALNPWVYADLTGRRLLVAHGTEDRIASPARAEQVARSLSSTADSVGVLRVRGGKHAMLARGSVFERAAADFVTATLLGSPVGAPVEGLLEGETSTVV